MTQVPPSRSSSAIGTVAPIDELIARYVEPSTPDQMLDANARAAATISASATRGAVAIEEREFFDPQSGNMVRVSGDLKAKLVHARTGMPVGWCGHHPCALNPKVCLLEQENERQLNEYADRCQSLASESYLRLHEKVSIGRSIASGRRLRLRIRSMLASVSARRRTKPRRAMGVKLAGVSSARPISL